MSATSLRPTGTLRGSRISGMGAYRPARVVPNSELVEAIDSSDEWIRERSGIAERRWAADEESVVTMSIAAARQALDHAGLDGSDLGMILVATVSHEMDTPAAAPMVADALGSTAPAMDLSAACAGYCYGIATAADLVAAGTVDHVLVIGVELLSRLTDLNDRSTAFIFGDSAGAAIVSRHDVAEIGPAVWGSLGSRWDLIRSRDDKKLAMVGPSVFRWAVWDMAPVARQAMQRAGVDVADLDVFIPHQANQRITNELVKQLGLPDSIPVADDIKSTGNTSAASIPVAACRMLQDGTASSGDLALQIGFGAGLVYAAQVVRLP